MKLQLKAIKVALFASEETYCYEASLYADGRRVARVSNDGHGGPDYQDFDDPKIEKSVHDHFRAMPEEVLPFTLDSGEPCTMRPTLEGWCANQVAVYLEKQEAKRLARKAAKSVFFVEDVMDEDSYGAFKVPYSLENERKIYAQLARKGRKAFVVAPSFIEQHPHNWLQAARDLIPA